MNKSGGSTLGSNTSSNTRSSSNTASSISKSSSNTSSSNTSSKNTASSSSFGSSNNTFRGSGAGLGSTIQVSKSKPIGALGTLEDTRDAGDIYNTEQTLTDLQDQYSIILEQKMYAEVMRNLVGRESKEFQDWADSKDITLTQAEDITEFIDIMQEGEYTSDEKLNNKIEKVLRYIPDIVGSLTKNQAIAPGAKVVAGENPIVDEVKFAIEKVISPTLKKVGGLLEKRFGSEIGKQIGKSLTMWGEKLATLPSEILEGIGPADIVLSVVDASLLAIDKATGNYRQINHNIPDEVLGIPVVGQYIEILSSVRDLVDSAAGIPRDDEAIPQLHSRLQDDLWRPMITMYNNVMNEFGNQETAFQQLAQNTEIQAQRSLVYTDVLPRIENIAAEFGNSKKDMREFIMADLGIDKSQKQIIKDINKMIDFETGKITREQLEDTLTSTKVDVPEIRQIINGAEVKARVALDNVYTGQSFIKELETEIQTKKGKIKELRDKINNEARFLDMNGDNPFGAMVDWFKSLGGEKSASARSIEGWTREIAANEAQIQSLRDNEIPRLTQELEEMYGEFEDSLAEAQELGVDLSFLERSKNWDQALADIEDDTMFWESVLPGGLFF